MKFGSSFLVRVTQLTRSDWVCLSPTTSLKAFASTRQASVEMMRDKLENYVSTVGAHHISSVGRSRDGVSCPWGFLELSSDVWTCKLDKRVRKSRSQEAKRLCKLQAWIPINDKERFIAGCHAPDQSKEDTYRTVTEGIYRGAHHRLGRYLCPTCKGEARTRYHYAWELTPLGDFADTNDNRFRIALTESRISAAVISSNLCPDCFIRVISIVEPALASELESISLDFTNETFDPGESEDSLPERQGPPRDFVAAFHESPDSNWCLGLALASLYGQEGYMPDFGDALELAGDWLGLTGEEVTDICNDVDDSRCEELQVAADSVAWRAGWAILCGGLPKLLGQDGDYPSKG